MDAKKLFAMIEPHLDYLDHRERKSLSKLISSKRPERITSQHRAVLPIAKAKEHLKAFCQREMKREQKSGASL